MGKRRDRSDDLAFFDGAPGGEASSPELSVSGASWEPAVPAVAHCGFLVYGAASLDSKAGVGQPANAFDDRLEPLRSLWDMARPEHERRRGARLDNALSKWACAVPGQPGWVR
jgi:hypothetical protein